MPRSVKEIGLLLLLLSLGLIILFSYIPKAQTGFFSEAVNAVVRPFFSAIFFAREQLSAISRSYFNLVSVSRDNEFLKQENARLRLEIAKLTEKANENLRLKKFIGLKTSLDYPSILAQVVGLDASGVYRTVTINRGREDGINVNMPVMVADGVVGKVIGAYARTAQVGLVTDPMISIDARVDRTRDRGVNIGGANNSCVLKYLNRNAEVKTGDRVITSGLDGIFPKGMLIGVIESVNLGQQGLYLEAIVHPAASFHELEEVLVILINQGGFYVEPGLDARK